VEGTAGKIGHKIITHRSESRSCVCGPDLKPCIYCLGEPAGLDSQRMRLSPTFGPLMNSTQPENWTAGTHDEVERTKGPMARFDSGSVRPCQRSKADHMAEARAGKGWRLCAFGSQEIQNSFLVASPASIVIESEFRHSYSFRARRSSGSCGGGLFSRLFNSFAIAGRCLPDFGENAACLNCLEHWLRLISTTCAWLAESRPIFRFGEGGAPWRGEETNARRRRRPRT
jgi:hypothetical protein